jgi:hypothetical protein
MRTSPVRSKRPALAVTDRLDQPLECLVEIHLAGFNEDEPRVRAGEEDEARVEVGHDLSSARFSKYRHAAQDGRTLGPCLPASS